MKVYISADMEGITGVANWEEVDHNKPAYAQFQKQMSLEVAAACEGAIAAGAKACSFGKAFLFSLGAGGQKGVERLLENMQKEIRRNMVLMGCKSIKDLDASKIIYRN